MRLGPKCPGRAFAACAVTVEPPGAWRPGDATPRYRFPIGPRRRWSGLASDHPPVHGISLALSPNQGIRGGSRIPVPQRILRSARPAMLPKIPQGSPCGKGPHATTLRPVRCRCPWRSAGFNGAITSRRKRGEGDQREQPPRWASMADTIAIANCSLLTRRSLFRSVRRSFLSFVDGVQHLRGATHGGLSSDPTSRVIVPRYGGNGATSRLTALVVQIASAAFRA